MEKRPKLFSLQDANSLIPHLRPLIRQVVQESQALAQIQPDIQKARSCSKYGGGSYWGGEYLRLISQLTHLIGEVEATGVLVKDYRSGLCDFPHLKDGRVIYLCWRLDEEQVGFWHETDNGFSGRQPI